MKRSILLILLLLPSILQARMIEGIDFPEVVTVESSRLNLQGVAVRKKLFVDVYAAGFYSSDKVISPKSALDSKGSKEMRIVFIYNGVKPKKFISGWQESIAKNNSKAEVIANSKSLDKFYKVFADGKGLSTDDEITIRRVANGSTEVSVNKNLVLKIDDSKFYNILLSTWMGERPPSASFQKALLSK